jgi:hypothetical protein
MSIRNWIALKRFRIAYLIHLFRDPTLREMANIEGGTREMRNMMLHRKHGAWEAKAPKPEDYGLPPDTPRTKHLERQQRG